MKSSLRPIGASTPAGSETVVGARLRQLRRGLRFVSLMITSHLNACLARQSQATAAGRKNAAKIDCPVEESSSNSVCGF